MDEKEKTFGDSSGDTECNVFTSFSVLFIRTQLPTASLNAS